MLNYLIQLGGLYVYRFGLLRVSAVFLMLILLCLAF